MNAPTPTIAEQRDVLLFLSDPHRREELLKLIGDAEEAEARARRAEKDANEAITAGAAASRKNADDADVNAKKSLKLQEERAALADQVQAHQHNKADDVKRMAEWEQQLKAQADAQATIQAEIDRQVNELAAGRLKLDADLAEAEAIFARAEAVKSAMG